MLTKEEVLYLPDSLPDNFSIDQIVEKLVILYRVQGGLSDIEEGRSVGQQ